MIKQTLGDRIFNLCNLAIMIFLAVITLYPFLNVAAISFNEGIDTTINSSLIFPRKFTLENYMVAFKYPALKGAAAISMSRTVLGTLVHMLVVTLAAYALSKKDLLFRKSILTFYLLPTFINAGIVPYYINLYNLGLINNFLVYIFPVAFSFYDFLIIRTYIQGLPVELEESAIIDGASFSRIFLRIIIPMSIPAIAAITLFHAVYQWNEWFSSMVYVSDSKLFTLQYLLQSILKEAQEISQVMSASDYEFRNIERVKTTTETSVRMAVLMISTVPILIVYPFIQKYFAQGMMLGAIKG